MQFCTVSAWLSGSSVCKIRPKALSLNISRFEKSSARHAYKGETYTQQALYDHPVGRPERTGKTGDPVGPPPPPFPIGGRLVPVYLYTLRRSGPPQVSELFPLQVMSQSPAGVGAPPLEKEVPQSLRRKVNGQVLKNEVIDSTYNIRQSIPRRPGDNPRQSRQRCNFRQCYWDRRPGQLLGRLEPLRLRNRY